MRLFGLPEGDFRFQDLVLVIAALNVLWLLRNQRIQNKASKPLTIMFAVVVLGAAIIVTLILASDFNSREELYRIGYTYRYFSMLATMVVIAAQFSFFPVQTFRGAIQGFSAGIVVNLLWITFQIIAQRNGALLSLSPENPQIYGPTSVGEQSPFGTGQILVVAMMFLLSASLFAKTSWFSGLYLLAAGGIVPLLWAANSRASIVSAALIVPIALSFAARIYTRARASTALKIIGAASLVAVLSIYVFVPRLRLAPVVAAIRRRAEEFILPALSEVPHHPLTGLGPGGARTLLDSETHNTMTTILVDYGFFGFAVIAFIAGYAVLRISKSLNTGGQEPTLVFHFLSLLLLMNLVISGIVQESLNPANPATLTWVAFGLVLGKELVGTKSGPDKRSPEGYSA